MVVTVDTREPEPHPWERYLPEGWRFERGTLETGDFALAALPDGAVVERKTPADMVSCIGGERDRFERELKRGRYCGRMIVVIEGSLIDVVVAGRKMHYNAIIGSLSTWTLRYCPFVFAGSEAVAQVRDIGRLAKVVGVR